MLGWWMLTTRGPDEAGADPEMLNLLRWHGAEEVEHRSVAFDAYVAAGGRYLRRVAATLGVFVGMFSLWIVATGHLLRKDPAVNGWAQLPSLRRFRRAAKADRLPPIRVLLAALPRYLAPGYHPSHECRTQLAVDYLGTALP